MATDTPAPAAQDVVIKGLTSSGETFRPSDWSERLCGILSSFNWDQKMAYSPFVRPVTLNQVRCVIVDHRLADINPRVFEFVMAFAKDNDLQITYGHESRAPLTLVAA